MKNVVLLFLLSDYADWEAAYVAAGLNSGAESTPYRIKTVALTKDPVQSIGGFSVLPDYSIDTIPENYEALFLIGGTSWRNPEALKVIPLVKSAIENNKLVGGICDGSVFLAKNGFLNNVKHTSNSLEDIKEYGAENYTNEAGYQNEQAVLDGNILTANGSAPLEFAKLAFQRLELDTAEEIEQWYQFNKLGAVAVGKL